MTPPRPRYAARGDTDPDADRLLSSDPFALLTGMLLDQQIAIR
jgi:hypothetical protein